MKQFIKIAILFSTILFIHSCVFIRMDDSIDLGSNYRYIQDYPQTIIYHESKDYEGVGTEIVPPIVLEYNFNERFIIAKSKETDVLAGNNKVKLVQYWIIDKTSNGASVEPMDSITFCDKLIILGIEELRF